MAGGATCPSVDGCRGHELVRDQTQRRNVGQLDRPPQLLRNGDEEASDKRLTFELD
jgi:hypothetical protein